MQRLTTRSRDVDKKSVLVIDGEEAVRSVNHLDRGVEDVREDVIPHDLPRGAELDDLAGLHRADVVRVAGGEIDVVEDDDDGTAEFSGGGLRCFIISTE